MPSDAEVRLLAQERARIRTELGQALRLVPVSTGRAANPLLWIRRFPIAAAGLVAALLTFTFLRRKAPNRTESQRLVNTRPSWIHALIGELWTAVRRALTAALTARIVGMLAQPARTSHPSAPSRQQSN